jgi:hypothetical protein
MLTSLDDLLAAAVTEDEVVHQGLHGLDGGRHLGQLEAGVL